MPLANQPETMSRLLAELERRLRILEATSPLTSASIQDGALRVLDGSLNQRVVTGKQADGTYGIWFYDAAGNVVLKLNDTGLHALDTAAVEQLVAGNLGSGVYGIKVIRSGVPINLADYVFGASAGANGAFESTTSTSYTNLATDGPSATVTVGASGKVLIIGGAVIEPETSSGPGVIGGTLGFAGSGANTVADTDLGYVRHYDAVDAAQEVSGSAAGGRILTGLSAGSTTFKLRYKKAAGVAASVRFGYRWIFAQPL